MLTTFCFNEKLVKPGVELTFFVLLTILGLTLFKGVLITEAFLISSILRETNGVAKATI